MDIFNDGFQLCQDFYNIWIVDIVKIDNIRVFIIQDGFDLLLQFCLQTSIKIIKERNRVILFSSIVESNIVRTTMNNNVSIAKLIELMTNSVQILFRSSQKMEVIVDVENFHGV